MTIEIKKIDYDFSICKVKKIPENILTEKSRILRKK